MDQRGNIILGILIGFLVAGGLFGVYYLNTSRNRSQTQNPVVTSQSTPSPTPNSAANLQLSKPVVHLADNPSISLENVRTVLVVVQPSDVGPPLYDNWKQLANDYFGEVITFWSKVLDNKSKITFETYPDIIKGNLTATSYNFNSVYNEVRPILQEKDEFVPYFSKQSKEFLMIFIYVLSKDQHYYQDEGGTHYDNIGISVLALDNKETFRFYSLDPNISGRAIPSAPAHEMGHAFGLQHSNNDPSIRAKYLVGDHWTSSCDLMFGLGFGVIKEGQVLSQASTIKQDWVGYSPGNTTLSDIRCILPEQKQLFFK